MLPEILKEIYIEMLKEEGIDITSKFTPNKIVKAEIKAKEEGVMAGNYELRIFFETFNIKVLKAMNDGEIFKKNDILFLIEGYSREILNVERVALEILTRMCSIATMTRKFCEKVKNYNVKIAATRKTTPRFRYFEKRAVEIGGGDTHRLSLEDMVLIKDNHLVMFDNDVEKALKTAKENTSFSHKIEIEVRNKEQSLIAAKYADIIMFDNMSPEEVKECVKSVREINKNIILECSGGINFENVEEYAKTGVDIISIGMLTHSLKTIDISLEIL
ncbi:MAG: carboxylating nicotinate-nucleotide diphosphorylase [Candidatus Altarchaeaceae archaeon]